MHVRSEQYLQYMNILSPENLLFPAVSLIRL